MNDFEILIPPQVYRNVGVSFLSNPPLEYSYSGVVVGFEIPSKVVIEIADSLQAVNDITRVSEGIGRYSIIIDDVIESIPQNIRDEVCPRPEWASGIAWLFGSNDYSRYCGFMGGGATQGLEAIQELDTGVFVIMTIENTIPIDVSITILKITDQNRSELVETVKRLLDEGLEKNKKELAIRLAVLDSHPQGLYRVKDPESSTIKLYAEPPTLYSGVTGSPVFTFSHEQSFGAYDKIQRVFSHLDENISGKRVIPKPLDPTGDHGSRRTTTRPLVTRLFNSGRYELSFFATDPRMGGMTTLSIDARQQFNDTETGHLTRTGMYPVTLKSALDIRVDTGRQELLNITDVSYRSEIFNGICQASPLIPAIFNPIDAILVYRYILNAPIEIVEVLDSNFCSAFREPGPLASAFGMTVVSRARGMLDDLGIYKLTLALENSKCRFISDLILTLIIKNIVEGRAWEWKTVADIAFSLSAPWTDSAVLAAVFSVPLDANDLIQRKPQMYNQSSLLAGIYHKTIEE